MASVRAVAFFININITEYTSPASLAHCLLKFDLKDESSGISTYSLKKNVLRNIQERKEIGLKIQKTPDLILNLFKLKFSFASPTFQVFAYILFDQEFMRQL